MLKQKNSMLKGNIKLNTDLLEVYNRELSVLTEVLVRKKKKLISDINPYFKNIFKKIFGETFNLRMKLNSKLEDLSAGEIFKIFLDFTEKELILKTTYCGQHKDDFQIFLDDFPVQEYASLGQQKLSYFSVLFAFIEVFCCKFNESPIVLIDDVSGELDHIRLKQLLVFLKELNSQIFLTSANKELFLDDDKVRVLSVSDGVFS